jgi:SOS-response transcriptional repressor LexA
MTVYLINRPVLTRRQRRMLDYITTFREQHGYCVTVREIMAEFGIRSPHGVTCHLTALRKKGYLTWEPHQSRTLRPVEADPMANSNDELAMTTRRSLPRSRVA